jgi:hypothetical protein
LSTRRGVTSIKIVEEKSILESQPSAVALLGTFSYFLPLDFKCEAASKQYQSQIVIEVIKL